METDEERKKAGEDCSYHTAWPWRRRKKEEQKRNGFDLDLIWIEIGVFKKKKFQGMSSLAL